MTYNVFGGTLNLSQLKPLPSRKTKSLQRGTNASRQYTVEVFQPFSVLIVVASTGWCVCAHVWPTARDVIDSSLA